MSEFCRQGIPYCGAATENERCANVIVRTFGIDRIPLSKAERKLLLGVLKESRSDK